MHYRRLHRWDVGPRRAASLQSALRERLLLQGGPRSVRLVAGADVSFDRSGGPLHAAVVVLDMESMERVDAAAASAPARFPYVPGLLSFREVPVILKAFSRLRVVPDLLLCDGQGTAHPRGFGLACHLGLALDLPAIGCAKSRLVGTHAEPGPLRGDKVPLFLHGRRVGAVVRSRDRVAPLYVSPGHRISLPAAVRWTLACCRGLRIPEPTRQAHQEVNRLRLAARAGTRSR